MGYPAYNPADLRACAKDLRERAHAMLAEARRLEELATPPMVIPEIVYWRYGTQGRATMGLGSTVEDARRRYEMMAEDDDCVPVCILVGGAPIKVV